MAYKKKESQSKKTNEKQNNTKTTTKTTSKKASTKNKIAKTKTESKRPETTNKNNKQNTTNPTPTQSNYNEEKARPTKQSRLWFEVLGYAYNPFTIKPGFFDDAIFGYDTTVDNIIETLSEKNMAFLEGDFGLGKTTLLKFIVNEFKGRKQKIIYISRNRSDRAFNYAKLLKGASKGFAKLFGKKAKDVTLIVDETEKVNKKDCNQILQFYNKRNIKSVLFIDVSFKDARLSPEIKKEIGKTVFQLKPLDAKDAVELIRDRLEKNNELISDDYLKKIFTISKKNTRQYLLNVEDVCRHAIENGRTKVTKEDLSVLY